MRFGSLFSGIGGFDLALERAGMECAWQVEIDVSCQRVLAKHWPDVKRYEDVRDCGKENLEPVDLICGGFPCQDVSLAGKRAGLEGKRSTLWSEFSRIICELEPRWVVIENVFGLFSSDNGRFFGNILGDLAESGYDAEWEVLPASAFGAPHRRERVFIVAYTRGKFGIDTQLFSKDSGDFDAWWEDANKWGIDRIVPEMGTKIVPGLARSWKEINTKSKVCRMVDGVPDGLDRLKSLGNAVVPPVVEWIAKRIVQAER
jgi:DNA (cytosine-5)-methyltransferase 1